MAQGFVQEGLQSWWAPALAFLAGVISFASPCVLPVVPGYLSFVTGGQPADGRRPVLPMALFVLGFAVVFTALGAFGGVFVRFLRSSTGLRVAGVIVLVFGLFMLMYALRLGRPALYVERRPLLSRVRPGPAGAFPLGMAFAAGWTPCIGPVLAGIFAIAASQGPARGALLFFVYSLGLGLPFVLVGLGVNRLVRSLAFLKRNYHWVAGASGLVMVTIGVLLVTGLWQRVILPLQQLTNRFTPAL